MTWWNRLAASTTLSLVMSFVITGSVTCADAAAAEPQSVPLRIDIPEAIRVGTWPVTVGVPFPNGALPSGTPVSVFVDGTAISTQSTPLATWDRDGKSVRWLLLDFAVDAATARTSAYELRILPTQPVAVASPLKLTRQGDLLHIHTGAADFRLRTRGQISIEQVEVDGQSLVTPAQPARFLVSNQDGKTFYASGDLTDGGFVIEDQGPQRIGLKSEGWYTAEDDGKFCQHVIRLEFFANQTTVHVFHTLIFTETSDSAQISDLAIELPLAAGGARTGAFGIDDKDFSQAAVLPDVKQAYLVQDYKTRWDLQWQLFSGDKQEPLQTGERTGGWADLSTPSGGITAALRDAWQNYPNEFEIDDGKFIAHLWPRHGRQLDFRTKAILAHYGEKGVANIDGFFKAQNKPYARSIFDVYNNAMGVAKTHELWLDFHAGARTPARTVHLATQTHTPVLAQSTPAWNAASGALGPIAPKDPAACGEVDDMLDAMLHRYRYWQLLFADYGWIDFGDIHNDVRGDNFGVPVEGGRITTPWRYWDATHYGVPNAPWLYYFRTGERKDLEFAERNARHVMDIDRCHYGDDVNRIKGTHYYGNWSIIHWGGQRPTYVMLANYNRLEYMLYAYYMRGYRRGLDVMKEWGEAMSRFHDDKSVEFPLRMLSNQKLEHVRHFGPPLGNLLELYKVTWNERYLSMAKDYAEVVTRLPGTDPKHQGLIYAWEQFFDYATFTGDEKFREVLLGLAKDSIHGGETSFGPWGGHDSAYSSWGDVAVAYALTGDTAYRDIGVARLAMLRSRMNLSDIPNQRGTSGGPEGIYNSYRMRSIPFFLGVISQTPRGTAPQATPQPLAKPILKSASAMHLTGPRLSPLYILPDKGAPAELLILLAGGQKGTVHSPGGQVLAELETPARANRLHRLKLDPLANNDASYLIDFELRPTRSMDEYEDRGNIDLLAVHGAKVVAGPSTHDGLFNVFGPQVHFFVPSSMEELSVEVDTSDTWAAYAWFPIVNLYAPDGTLRATGAGPGKFTLKCTVPPEQRGKLWSIGPLSRVSAPKLNRKLGRPPEAHFPAWFKLPAECPPFVSPRADLFYIPTEQNKVPG